MPGGSSGSYHVCIAGLQRSTFYLILCIVPVMSLASFSYPFLLLKSMLLPANGFLPTCDPSQPSPLPIIGVHHLQFPVSNLDTSLGWYKSVLSASHNLALDHYCPSGRRCAVTMNLPGMGEAVLELRSVMGVHALAIADCVQAGS